MNTIAMRYPSLNATATSRYYRVERKFGATRTVAEVLGSLVRAHS